MGNEFRAEHGLIARRFRFGLRGARFHALELALQLGLQLLDGAAAMVTAALP